LQQRLLNPLFQAIKGIIRLWARLGILVAIFYVQYSKLQWNILNFNLKDKYMRKNYQHLLRLFFMSFVLNSVTSIVCLAEEMREDKPIEDISSAYVFSARKLATISIIEQRSLIIFSYQGFAASLWNDINNNLQWSALLNITHTYEFNESVRLKSSASASYSKREEMAFIQRYDGRRIPMMDNYDGTISVSLPISVTESFYLVPTFTYAFPLGNDSRHNLRDKGIANPLDKSSSFVFGGLSLSFTF